MKANISVSWLLVAAMCLSSCGGENTPQPTPVASTEIAPDGLDYPDPNRFTQGVPITPLVPTVARGIPTNYMVVPDLPAGLRLEGNGVISGTPTEPRATTTYLVTAGNSAGVTSFGVRISVAGRYTLGGIVSGLSGAGLVLTNNGGDHLAIGENGPFTFAQAMPAGAAYSVGIATQPAGQECSVAGGSGNFGNGNLGTVVVTCGTTLTSALRAMAAANPILLACTPKSALDVLEGAASPVYEFPLRDVPAPAACGPLSVARSAHGNWIYVTNTVTGIVSVYATRP